MFRNHYNNRISKKKLFFVILGIFFIVLMSYSLFKNYLVSQEVNLEIKTIENQITTLQTENIQLQELVKYFDSSAYAEQKARAELSLQKQGESVVVITDASTATKTKQLKISKTNDDSNPTKWFKYLFVKK